MASIDYNTVSSRFSVHNSEEIEEGIKHLNEYGYAVFSNALSSEEITSNIDLFWEYLENLRKPYEIRRNDANTWNNPWPDVKYVGIIPYEGIPHSQFMWSIRGNPHVKHIFAQIWQTSELLVSFDAAGCFRDWHLNPEWKTNSAWYHCDQNPTDKPDRCSIQGFVSLTDTNQTSGGLVVVPQSHKYFQQLKSSKRFSRGRKNYVKVTQYDCLLKQFQPRLVHCRAGDLVVFDSRTIHCNTPGLDINFNNNFRENTTLVETENPRLLRLVGYVCMSPITMVPSDQLEEFRKKREEFVRERIACTHWPCELNISGDPVTIGKQSLRLSKYQQSLITGIDFDPNDPTAREFIDL